MILGSDRKKLSKRHGAAAVEEWRDAGILPEVYAKSLLYRSPNLTNVFVQSYYGMYNYSELGLK